MGFLRKWLLSEENIFLAIYLAETWMQNAELLDEDDQKSFRAIKDVFDQANTEQIISDVKAVLEKILDDSDAFFRVSVYFKPKGNKNNRTVFRPLHTASLIDQISMVAMLQVLIYEMGTEGKLIPSELSRMLPSNFYGNRISYTGHSLFKPWQDQYHEYTSRANECLAEYSQSGVYNYEVNLDLENFFPSIDPQVLFQFIRARFPLKWGTEDTKTAEIILRKLLLFELNPLDETEWKWYLNDENATLPQGTLYAKGQPQGLPHAYFTANMFMLLVQEEYKKVFPGEMLFYVDDSVIFTNGLQEGELDERTFAQAIDRLNDNIRQRECELREQFVGTKFLPNGCEYIYGVHVHEYEPGGKSVFASTIDGKHCSGELYLHGLSRETSIMSFDLKTMFSDEDVKMLLSRTQAITEVIENELKRMNKEETEETPEKESNADGKNEVIRKKLLRYKKFFSYRKTLLSYRNTGDLKELTNKIIEAISIRENDANLDAFWEMYNDDILAVSIQFVLKRSQGENEQYQKIILAVEKLCDVLYGNSKKHAYLRKSYKLDLDLNRTYDDVGMYCTLKRIMECHYCVYKEQVESKKQEHFDILLKMNSQSLFDKFGLSELFAWSRSVRCNTSELERRILNAAFSYLFEYDTGDSFVFAKKSRKPIQYSEIRVLAALKNKHFSHSQFVSSYSELISEEYQRTIDYSLLQVMEIFKTFVRDTLRIDQLIRLHKYCCDTWKNGSKHLHFYTLHNQDHAVELIKLAVQWMHAISLFKLKRDDHFILFAACYLHDISMVSLPDYSKFYTGKSIASNRIFTDVEKAFQTRNTIQAQEALLKAYHEMDAYFENEVRRDHAKDSAHEIRKFEELDFIESGTREFIARVSAGHGENTEEVYCTKAKGASELVNEKLIKILLRLSDLLDMSRYRVSDLILRHNLSKIGNMSRFHWLSHMITSGCSIATEYAPSTKISLLGKGCITETLVITVDVLMSQTTPVLKTTPCQCVKSSKLTNNDGNVTIKLVFDENAMCPNGTCNFLCKWFALKNNYLMEELGALQQYLSNQPEMFYDLQVEVQVRVIEDGGLPNELFDHLRDYVMKAN